MWASKVYHLCLVRTPYLQTFLMFIQHKSE
nr:MAG TPA: hypothetical protein [Caudoviricetes sp.]